MTEISQVVYRDERAFVQDDILNSELFNCPLESEKPAIESHLSRKIDPGLRKIIICSVVFASSILVALIISNYLLTVTVIKHGGVASTTHVCSNLGILLMSHHHGNAVDALVGTALCEALQNNNNCGLLGGGILVYRHQVENANFVYSFLGNDPDQLLNESARNALGIPALLKGLSAIHKNHGSLDWKIIIEDLSDGLEIQKATNMEHVIDVLRNMSDESGDSFYGNAIVTELANQSVNGFPSLQIIQNYKVAPESPISFQFEDFVIDVAPPPSDGILLVLFLNIVTSLRNQLNVNPNSAGYADYIREATAVTNSHLRLFMTNKTQDILTLLSNKDYAKDLAVRIFNHEAVANLVQFDLTDYVGTQTSNVVVVGPNDDIVSLSLTLGLKKNETAKNIYDQKLNANNRPIINAGPVILSNPEKPCLLRIGVTHQGPTSCATEIGHLILELVDKIGAGTNVSAMVSKATHENSTDNKFVFVGKYKELILVEPNSQTANAY